MYKHWVEYQTIKVSLNDMEYIAKVKVHWSYDPNYGADADGNRGVSQDSIDEVVIEEVVEIFGALVSPVSNELQKLICEAVE